MSFTAPSRDSHPTKGSLGQMLALKRVYRAAPAHPSIKVHYPERINAGHLFHLS
jgi:hypothetical protein